MCCDDRELADIAAKQAAEALQLAHNEKGEIAESERAGLRQALRDVQARTDEQALIGKSHRQAIEARVALQKAKRDLEAKAKDCASLQAQLLKAERELDKRNAELYRLHRDFRRKTAEREREALELKDKAADGLSVKQVLFSTVGCGVVRSV